MMLECASSMARFCTGSLPAALSLALYALLTPSLSAAEEMPSTWPVAARAQKSLVLSAATAIGSRLC